MFYWGGDKDFEYCYASHDFDDVNVFRGERNLSHHDVIKYQSPARGKYATGGGVAVLSQRLCN